MAERIGADVAIGLRVLRAAAADRIEHDDHAARHAVLPCYCETTPLTSASSANAALNKALV